jgi:tellurium resistance protein TerD
MSDVVSLEKGGAPVNISDQFPSLTEGMVVGLGWKPADTGKDFDLDSVAVLLDENKKVVEGGINFFNALEYKVNGEAVVIHSKDDLTGGSSEEGDDETITVKLKKLPESIKHVVVFVNIYQATERGQKFGQVNDSYMRLLDAATEKEVVRNSLKKEFAENTGVVLADIYRFGSEWKVKAISQGVNGDINEIVSKIPSLLG